MSRRREIGPVDEFASAVLAIRAAARDDVLSFHYWCANNAESVVDLAAAHVAKHGIDILDASRTWVSEWVGRRTSCIPLPSPFYEDENATIYCGSADDILPALVGGGISAIITDPPYGVGIKYDGTWDDNRKDYWTWMAEMVDTMRAVAPTVGFTHRVAALRHLHGWDWVGVWNKPNAMSGLNQLPIMPHWEPVFMYGIKGRKDLPRRFDVLSINPAVASKSWHPCPKPVELYTALIDRLSLPGDTVLDPFMGSGTTLVAAARMGRKVIGIDQSEAYCAKVVERIGQGVLAL